MSESCGATQVWISSVRAACRCGEFRHAAGEIDEVAVQLLEHKAERVEMLDRLGRQVAGEPLVPDCADLLCVGVQRRLEGIEGCRAATEAHMWAWLVS